MNQRFEAGQFIKFTYNPPPPPPRALRPQAPKKAVDAHGHQVLNPDGSPRLVPQPAVRPQAHVPPSDKNKEVFVIHPNWNQCVHAIDLKRITPAEQQVLRAMMDPAVKAAVDAGQWPVDGAPNFPLLRDILRRQNPPELIKQPLSFYNLLLKPFIRNKDCYRIYKQIYMFGAQVVRESTAGSAPMTNYKPLFKKI